MSRTFEHHPCNMKLQNKTIQSYSPTRHQTPTVVHFYFNYNSREMVLQTIITNVVVAVIKTCESR